MLMAFMGVLKDTFVSGSEFILETLIAGWLLELGCVTIHTYLTYKQACAQTRQEEMDSQIMVVCINDSAD